MNTMTADDKHRTGDKDRDHPGVPNPRSVSTTDTSHSLISPQSTCSYRPPIDIAHSFRSLLTM